MLGHTFATLLFAASAALVCRSSLAQSKLDDDARNAVHKSLDFLKSDQQQWRTKRHCASCHHGPMYVWSSSVAARQGYKVDLVDVEETAHWLVSSDEARIFSRAPDSGENKLSQATIFLAHALNALPAESPSRQAGWERITQHWLATQKPDGTWVGSAGRPPIFSSPEVVTRLLDLAVLDHSRPGNPSDDAAKKLTPTFHEKARTWLAGNAHDQSHQSLVLRLSWETQIDSQSKSTVAELTKKLFDLQREDGGWRQADDLESDAFATGQTLMVLHQFGAGRDNAVVERAIKFLVATQRKDGSWPMKSRPNPANGQPAGNLNPITYAATAWSTIGLVMYVPELATQGR